MTMRGVGKQKVLRSLFPANARTLAVPQDDSTEAHIHVQACVHLGGIVDKDGSMKAEARRRIAFAASAFQRQSKMLLQNVHIHLLTRGALFRRLVTTTIFNLELWTEQTPPGRRWM